MNNKTKTGAVLLALLADVFYAINTPFSKVLLNHVSPTLMAAFQSMVQKKLWKIPSVY